jgi:hypothetical protein
VYYTRKIEKQARYTQPVLGSESERIRAFFAKSEIFVPDSVSDSDSDPVPDPVI